MPVADSLGTRLIRIFMLLCGLIYAYGFWVNRSLAFTDFRVLHLGAGLINDGRTDEAYDADAFTAAAAAHPELGSTARELDVFISTPPFAMAMQPFAWLSSNTALVVWMVLGVAAVFAAVKVLRLPAWAGLIALVMPLGVANIYHAQTGFLALLWAAVIHRLCVDGKTVPAGLVAGLAVLKPTLLLGVALWWLLDWRRWYLALLSAFAVGTALMIPTVIGGLDWWRSFFGALDQRAELDLEVVANQPTLAELVNRLVGVDVGSHPVALVIYVLVGAAVMHLALRRWPDRVELLSGAAVIISVLISPHLLIYDTPLVVVPFAVAVRAGVSLNTLEQLAAVYIVSSLMTIVSFSPFGTINAYVVPGTIGMLIAGVVWFQALDSSHDDIDGLTPDITHGIADDGGSGLAEAA